MGQGGEPERENPFGCETTYTVLRNGNGNNGIDEEIHGTSSDDSIRDGILEPRNCNTSNGMARTCERGRNETCNDKQKSYANGILKRSRSIDD